jgi:hypothetical protein
MLPARRVSSRRTTRGRAAAAMVSAALLGTALLGGCSGSGTPEPSAAPPAPVVTVGPNVVVPESDGGGAPKPSPSPSPEASPSAGETGCADLQTAWNRTNQALVNLSADHPRALVNSFRVAGEAMGKVEKAPEPIAKPWATMSDYLKRVNDALDKVDPDDAAAVSRAMADTVSAADTQTATAAGEKVTAFIAGGCKS